MTETVKAFWPTCGALAEAIVSPDFACESAHIETLDPAFADLPIVREREDRSLHTVMSNSFGFGGTNGCLVMTKL